MLNIIGPDSLKSWFSLSGNGRSVDSLSEVDIGIRS